MSGNKQALEMICSALSRLTHLLSSSRAQAAGGGQLKEGQHTKARGERETDRGSNMGCHEAVGQSWQRLVPHTARSSVFAQQLCSKQPPQAFIHQLTLTHLQSKRLDVCRHCCCRLSLRCQLLLRRRWSQVRRQRQQHVHFCCLLLWRLLICLLLLFTPNCACCLRSSCCLRCCCCYIVVK